MFPLCQKGLTYCRQLSLRTSQYLCAANKNTFQIKQTIAPSQNLEQKCELSISSRLQDISHPYKFKVPSPYKKPGARRHGYKHTLFDGGPLPRDDKPVSRPLPRDDKPVASKNYQPRDSWSKKRALFGQNDYIDILGDGNIHPVELIEAPAWLRGFRGNELQRLSRRLNFEGRKIQQLYPLRHHQMWKRVKYLSKKYNMKRGKGGKMSKAF